MELYTHSKLSTVQKERLELLKKPQIVELVRFDSCNQAELFRSPESFRRFFKNFYQSKKPGGFAPSSAQPSGVLGQGTNLDGKYYEIECSECYSESCVNCGLIQGWSV